MSIIDLDYCNCDCHMEGMEISHIRPCCNTCEFCHQDRISDLAITKHEEQCYKNPKNKQIFIN